MLAAKAVVIGAVASVTGLAASIIAITRGEPREENKGQFLLPTTALKYFKVLTGTAALVAVVAVFAVVVGAVMRRSTAAITVIVVVVLPFPAVRAERVPVRRLGLAVAGHPGSGTRPADPGPEYGLARPRGRTSGQLFVRSNS